MKFAGALRCIAQELERRGLKTFDIRLLGREYVIEGGYQEPPAPTPVTIHYTANDINDLDEAGEAKRGESAPNKDFLNPVQIFRTIGGYLDRNEARLIRITNKENQGKEATLRIEYVTREGDHVIDDRAGSALYDMCVLMYKQRGRLTGTAGRGSRSRR